MSFLEKIPRLNDRYFQSRPTYDMAERCHPVHQIRELPWLAGQLVRATMTLSVTALAICALQPGIAPIAMLATLFMIGLPLLFQPRMRALDLRSRTHAGALSRFYLDALLGITAIRSHGAERSARREHESLLGQWVHTNLQLIRSFVVLQTVQAMVGFGFAVWLLVWYEAHRAEAAGGLLLAYWALHLPVLGGEITEIISRYPLHRNLVLRLIEPLGAPEEALTTSITTAFTC